MLKLFRTAVFCAVFSSSLFVGTDLMGRASADTITFSTGPFFVAPTHISSFGVILETNQQNASITVEASQELVLDQFDPSLGTLNAVTFALTSSLTDPRSSNPAGTIVSLAILFGPDNHGTAEIAETLTVSTDLTGVLFSDSFGLQTECTVVGGSSSSCNSTIGAFFAFDDVDVRLPLAGFQGLGTYPVEFTNSLEFSLAKDVDTGSFIGGSAQGPWSGILEVTYTYNIPEPGALVLLALGLPGLLGFRRRRVAA